MTRVLEKLYRFRLACYLILIAVAYGTSLDVPFYFDDIHSIQDNVALRDISNVTQFWVNPDLTSSLPANRSYRPATFMVYNALMVAGNGSTLPFHIYKLLLLLGLCLLIERIWNELTKGKYFGFTLACMWAVHPALSESSVYLTATSSQQAAFFYFLAFWFYLKNPSRVLPVALAYALSCFSKEEGITLPAILFLYELFLGNWRKQFKSIAVVSIVGAALCIFIQTRIPAAQSVSRGSVTPWSYFLTQIRGWLHYEWLWIWPHDLNADNTHFGFSTSILDVKVLASGIIQLLVTLWLWSKRKSEPLLIFGWLWYYLSITPASSIIPLAEPVNERRMIIAYLGYTGMLQWGMWKLILRKFGRSNFGVRAVFVSWVLLACTFTIARIQTWRDPLLLWSDVVQKNPGSPRAINNLASEKINRRDYEGALVELQKCLEIEPYLYCKINQGIALSQLHRYQEAREALEYACANSENVASPHYYLAFYWFDLSEFEKALAEVEIALKISNGTHSPSQNLKEEILQAMQDRR